MVVLKDHCDGLSAPTHTPQIDNEQLAAFVQATRDSPISRSERLIFFAACMEDEIGWSGVCRVFEYVLSEGEDCGAYAAWLAIGLTAIRNNKLPLEERAEIAREVEKILARAKASNKAEFSAISHISTKSIRSSKRANASEGALS